MNSGFLQTTSFRRIHLSVVKYRLTKNGFAGLKNFRAFKKQAPAALADLLAIKN